jgi:hypothetical protein
MEPYWPVCGELLHVDVCRNTTITLNNYNQASIRCGKKDKSTNLYKGIGGKG